MIDVQRYGGYRGYLAHLRACAMYSFGVYPGRNAVDWSSVNRLVFICKGNICRSPYADARARLFGVRAASFGLNASPGSRADPLAVRNAGLRGVDLAAHRSAILDRAPVAQGDLLIVFEPAQLREVYIRVGRAAQVALLGIWTPPYRPHVQDPYGRTDRYFQQCFAVIDANVAELARRMRAPGRGIVDTDQTGDACDANLRHPPERAR